MDRWVIKCSHNEHLTATRSHCTATGHRATFSFDVSHTLRRFRSLLMSTPMATRKTIPNMPTSQCAASFTQSGFACRQLSHVTVWPPKQRIMRYPPKQTHKSWQIAFLWFLTGLVFLSCAPLAPVFCESHAQLVLQVTRPPLSSIASPLNDKPPPTGAAVAFGYWVKRRRVQ